jgi:hypothetical protein
VTGKKDDVSLFLATTPTQIAFLDQASAQELRDEMGAGRAKKLACSFF